MVVPPSCIKLSISRACFIIHHPFWGTHIMATHGNPHGKSPRQKNEIRHLAFSWELYGIMTYVF